MYDVSVWVSTQSRGIYKEDDKRDGYGNQKKKKSKPKDIGLIFGGSLIMQTVIGEYERKKII